MMANQLTERGDHQGKKYNCEEEVSTNAHSEECGEVA